MIITHSVHLFSVLPKRKKKFLNKIKFKINNNIYKKKQKNKELMIKIAQCRYLVFS